MSAFDPKRTLSNAAAERLADRNAAFQQEATDLIPLSDIQ
jgi:hypothetical protein